MPYWVWPVTPLAQHSISKSCSKRCYLKRHYASLITTYNTYSSLPERGSPSSYKYMLSYFFWVYYTWICLLFFEPAELLKLSPSGPTNSLANLIFKKMKYTFQYELKHTLQEIQISKRVCEECPVYIYLATFNEFSCYLHLGKPSRFLMLSFSLRYCLQLSYQVTHIFLPHSFSWTFSELQYKVYSYL